MASVTYNFTQADGALVGWDPISALTLVAISNQASTSNNTGWHGAARDTALTLSGDMDVSADIDASLVIGGGGVMIWLVQPDGSGWGVFAGNAVHIYPVAAPGVVETELTNSSRPGEGSGHLAGQLRFTRTAAGAMEIFWAGASIGGATDTRRPAGGIAIIQAYSMSSPTVESTIDNLYISDTIGGAPAPIVYPRSTSLWGRALGLR